MTRASTRLRVGFDARALVFPAGGVRRYVGELFSALPAIAPDIDVVAVDPPPGITLPTGTLRGPRAAVLPSNLARAAVALPRAIRRAGLDLFHAPAYTAPIAGGTPVLLTIHDVSYARRPEFYPHPSGRLRQWFYRRSAVTAARIQTDSEFSRREIVAAYGIPESRISVVPLGVGAPFTPLQDTRSQLSPGSGVAAPYVLHVGDLHPRRDLITALNAVIEVRRRGGAATQPLRFVCAGRDCGSADGLRAAAAAAGMTDALVMLGTVAEDQLVALYQHAIALVYPSLYEGFGLPVLEAMACGLPVVAADAGSVPEVLGAAGILVPPGDVRSIAEAVTALATQPERQALLRQQGLARASIFSWERTARATLGVYRACLGLDGPAPKADTP